jgi:hypothetical protein
MLLKPDALTVSYAVQNTLAVIVFGGLVLTNVLAILLHSFPGQELLWVASLHFHRVFGKLLDLAVFGGGLAPELSLALLLCLAIFPVWSFLRRNWLGTAVSGHVALALCVLIAWDAIHSATITLHSASLVPIVSQGMRDINAAVFVTMAAAAFVLCIINHIVFFRRA